MNKTKLSLVLLIISAAYTFADSPITSTDFYRAYLDFPIVSKAKDIGVIDFEIAEYLHSESIPLELKAAVMNALSWGPEEKRNAEFYSYYLALEYGLPIYQLNPDRISATDVFCLGYLTVLDDYFQPSYGVFLLDLALDQFQDSFMASIITALARAQDMVMSDVADSVWPVIDEVVSNPSITRDIRPAAFDIILDYMLLYR